MTVPYPSITLLFIAYLVNIPLGYIREAYPKFSPKWLFWIHASIPLIIYLRVTWKTSKLLIPVTIAAAVFGQIAGSRLRSKRMSQDETDELNQIPDIQTQPHPKIDASKVTVALLNMGGPKTNADVPDFQRRLFADSLLIRFPLSSILQGLFAWLLITFRAKETAERYQLIGGGSPIYPSTEAQVDALKNELKSRNIDCHVTYSFNYSPPLPEDTINEIKNAGSTHILPLSMYPHYSKATTGSNIHYLKEAAKNIYPQLEFLPNPSYYLADGYIQAFVDRINETVNADESLDDFYLLFSAHGLPLYFLTEGDPYPYQISQTVAKILDKLKRGKQWSIAYQSAVGPLQWLKPSTDDMLKALADRGVKKIIIVPISFVGDHIETTCEIDMEYREYAEPLGITDFRMSKAIEHHPNFISALADSVEEYIQTPVNKNNPKMENSPC